MAIRKDLGPVTAYAIAVANGFTGTEAEWTAMIANASTAAQDAAQSAGEAAQSAKETADLVEDAKSQLKLRDTVKVIFMPVAYFEYVDAAGDCTVFVTNLNKKVIMIDAGSAHSYSLIKSELTANNITHIDVFILSHYHGDHYGNIKNLISDSFIDENTISYLPRTTKATVSNWGDESGVRSDLSITKIKTPNSNEPLNIDGITFDFFNCDASDIAYYDAMTDPDCNDYSVCCYVTYKKTRILMTGDIQLRGEQYLYDNGRIKQCDILKIPHHASNDNVGSDFYLTANPKYAIASANVWEDQRSRGGVLNSLRVAYLTAVGSKNYMVGNGAMYVGIGDKSYTLFPNAHDIISYILNGLTLTVIVDQSYNGQISNGTSKYPFKSLQQAIGFAEKLNAVRQVTISIKGTYNDAIDSISVSNAQARIAITGERPNNDNLVTLKDIHIMKSNVELSNLTFSGTAQAIPVEFYESKGTLSNVTINGNTRNAANIAYGRGVVANRSEVIINNCIISNKRAALGCYNNGIIDANHLTGENNEYLIYGNGHSVTIASPNITYEKLNTATDGIKISHINVGDKYFYSRFTPFTLFKDDEASGSRTTTLDLSDDTLYARKRFVIYYGDGSIYTFSRWGGSISDISRIVAPTIPGITALVASSSGKQLTLTYSSLISLVCVN